MQNTNIEYQNQSDPEESREIQEQIQRIDRLRQLEKKHSSKLINLLSPIQTMKDKKEMEQLRLDIAAFEEMIRRREANRKRNEARLKRREAIRKGESPLGWILPVVLIMFALTLFSMKGIIGGIVFLVVAAYLSPVCKRFLAERQIYFNNKAVIPIIVVALGASAMLTPGIYDNKDKSRGRITGNNSETADAAAPDKPLISSTESSDNEILISDENASTLSPEEDTHDSENINDEIGQSIADENRENGVPEYIDNGNEQDDLENEVISVDATFEDITQDAVTEEVVIATTNVNVREQPNTTCSVLGMLIPGDTIARFESRDDGWSLVSYNGQNAYVKSEYLASEAEYTAYIQKELEAATVADSGSASRASGGGAENLAPDILPSETVSNRIGNPTPAANNPKVYVTKTGEKYHRYGCSYLRNSCIEITLEEAINKGYTPCSRCKP